MPRRIFISDEGHDRDEARGFNLRRRTGRRPCPVGGIAGKRMRPLIQPRLAGA